MNSSNFVAGVAISKLRKLLLQQCNPVSIFFSRTAVEVGIDRPSYLVAEDAGHVMVCAAATRTLAQVVNVTFTTMDGSAVGQSVFYVNC